MYKSGTSIKFLGSLNNFDELEVRNLLLGGDYISHPDRVYYLVPCGKCEACVNAKRSIIANRVRAEFKKVKYKYLLTITFNDENIDLLYCDRDSCSNTSKYSTLSRRNITNILKNLKNKFKRYYGYDVHLSYLVAGEYGETTKRAHYHIILGCDEEIPNLIKLPVKGDYWASKFLDSKQYGHYNLQKILKGDKTTSNYLTKYLTKSSSYKNYINWKYDWWDWLKFYKTLPNFDWDSVYFPSNCNFIWACYLYQLLLLDFPRMIDLNTVLKLGTLLYSTTWTKLNFQRPFVFWSRGLGISDDPFVDFDNGVLNYYYRNRLPGIQSSIFNKLYAEKRLENIKLYFASNRNPRPSRRTKKDIF